MEILMENAKFALKAEYGCSIGPLPMYRLVAKRDIGADVKAGDLGGLVSGSACLSDEGDCWVYPGGGVYAGGRVAENATVRAGANVSANATLRGNSKLHGGVNLVGGFDLCGNETLEAREALIVNVVVARMGQYVLEAQTMFVLEFELGGGIASKFVLPAAKCSGDLAAHLACRQPGDRVAFLRLGTGLAHPLLPDAAGHVLFRSLEKTLTQLQTF
jgi:hypothetical protein